MSWLIRIVLSILPLAAAAQGYPADRVGHSGINRIPDYPAPADSGSAMMDRPAPGRDIGRSTQVHTAPVDRVGHSGMNRIPEYPVSAYPGDAKEEPQERDGDGSPQDSLCKKYGLKPQTSGYAECRMRIDFAEAESRRQQEQFEREQAEYERRVAAIERERERQKGLRLLELGSRLMAGQSITDALGSIGTGAPIAPRRPSPIMQTIRLPGGQLVNCTTMFQPLGSMTNCF
jgi:hypothetical protein